MKLIIFTSALMLTTAAQGWQFPKVGAEGGIEEMRQMQWVKEHSLHASISVHIQGQCVHNCVRPIDGAEDSVQISDARTGLPDEFEERVAHINKMKERYGR